VCIPTSAKKRQKNGAPTLEPDAEERCLSPIATSRQNRKLTSMGAQLRGQKNCDCGENKHGYNVESLHDLQYLQTNDTRYCIVDYTVRAAESLHDL